MRKLSKINKKMRVRLYVPKYHTCMSPLNSSPTFLPLPWPILLIPPRKPSGPHQRIWCWDILQMQHPPYSLFYFSMISFSFSLLYLESALITWNLWIALIHYYILCLWPWSPSPYHCAHGLQESKLWPTSPKLHGSFQPGEGSDSETQ